MGDASIQKSKEVTDYLEKHLGQQIGNGECYTTVDEALTDAKLKSARDFGKITPTADYVWGRKVEANDVRAGDVIQFSSYRVTIITVTREDEPDGSWSENQQTETYERPHHSAVVQTLPSGTGPMTVYESNVNGSRDVQSNQLYMQSVPKTKTTTGGDGETKVTVTRTVTVTGKIKFYRPQTP